MSINNSYNAGRISGISPGKDTELYVAGMAEGIATVNNFYNSGAVKLKAGNLGEINGEALTNIRPGENTKTFNYCYWAEGILPFPLLQKAQSTSSAFHPESGRLSGKVIVNSKAYTDILNALNAWVAGQKKGYLQWTGKEKPIFKASFGFAAPVKTK